MGYLRGTCRASAKKVWVVRRAGCEQLFRFSGAMRCATATGVHAADVINAFKKNNAALVDTVYSGIPKPGRPHAGECSGPDVGIVEQYLWLVACVSRRRRTHRWGYREGHKSPTVLTDQQIRNAF